LVSLFFSCPASSLHPRSSIIMAPDSLNMGIDLITMEDSPALFSAKAQTVWNWITVSNSPPSVRWEIHCKTACEHHTIWWWWLFTCTRNHLGTLRTCFCKCWNNFLLQKLERTCFCSMETITFKWLHSQK
jgi:hypothetical protein